MQLEEQFIIFGYWLIYNTLQKIAVVQTNLQKIAVVHTNLGLEVHVHRNN
jgi:hypothetical protein